jgi:hypothetical protein
MEAMGEMYLDDGQVCIFQRSARNSPAQRFIHSAFQRYGLARTRQSRQNWQEIAGHPVNIR